MAGNLRLGASPGCPLWCCLDRGCCRVSWPQRLQKDGPPPSRKLARTKELSVLTQQPQGAGVTEPLGQMAGWTLLSPAGAIARSRRGPPGFPPPLFLVGTGLGLLPQTVPVPGPLDAAQGKWGTHGMRISCTLLMICLPTMMTRSSCASSMRQPPAAHCTAKLQVSAGEEVPSPTILL